jgi:hypothetical protein
MEIKLTQGKVAIVDDEDFDELNKYHWYAYQDQNNWYARRQVGGRGKQKTILLHREILNASRGSGIDHINGNGLDNRKENLRICTNPINNQNRHRIYGVSQYQGVCKRSDGKKWIARITVNKKLIYLGSFLSEGLAAVTYNIAALRYYGANAKINNV